MINFPIFIPILASCITVFLVIVVGACVLCVEPSVVRIRRIGR